MPETSRQSPKVGDLINFQIPMINTTDPLKCNMWRIMSGIVIDTCEKSSEILVLSCEEFFTIKPSAVYYSE